MQKSVNFLELIGGGKIPEVLIGTWIVMGILIVFGFIARASIAGAADPIVPDEGLTIRSVTDCLIAAIAWRRDATVVHADVDFDRIAARYPVQVMSLLS